MSKMRILKRRLFLLCLGSLILVIGLIVYADTYRSRRRPSTMIKRNPNRFVLGLNYWEQFTMALNNFFKLTALASEWDARSVTPFTYNSRLYGLKNFKPDENMHADEESLSLSAIYDMDSMATVVERMGLPPTVSFEEFFMLAPRQLIVVHFIAEKSAHELPVLQGEIKSYLLEHFKLSNVVDCHSRMAEFGNYLLNALRTETLKYNVPSFSIHKYFCVNISQHTTPQMLGNQIGIQNRELDVAVIFYNWRGFFDRKVLTASAKGKHSNNRLLMSGCDMKPPEIIQHSSRVHAAARQYVRYLNLTGNNLFIHLRSEKMGLRENRFPGSISKCLDRVLNLKDSIVNQFSNVQTFVVTDYGPYSSGTCIKCKGSITMSNMLASRGLNPTYYDPVALGEVGDRGFAAAVELNVMASAKYLILCGGGAYQNQAAKRFLQDHNSDTNTAVERLHRVCIDDETVNAVFTA